MRRDVSRADEAVAVCALRLGSVLRVAQGKVVHVQLVGHDCDGVEVRICGD